ncbi:hypothetical protein [Burkholderia sp. WSM2230]|uniref:hypothetical protein n=1 Tax=Burkholderia sp. WSM2230 TaxID=944435 RepID=UPI0004286554|nr:hypothetical protein [Burkholderia sp. WSM2230]
MVLFVFAVPVRFAVLFAFAVRVTFAVLPTFALPLMSVLLLATNAAAFFPLPSPDISSTTAYIAAPAFIATRTGHGPHRSIAAHRLHRLHRLRHAVPSRGAPRYNPLLAAAAVPPPLSAA